MKAGNGVGTAFYRKYKRILFVGLGVLIILNSLALGLNRHLDMSVFALCIALLGMSGLAYLDQKEGEALVREARADIDTMIPPPDRALVLAKGLLTLALLQVDDYDEVFQDLTDEQRPLLVAAVDKYLREWAAGLKAYLRKDDRDRYLALIPAEEQDKLEDTSFPIIDQIREVSVGHHLPVTLSIGAVRVTHPAGVAGRGGEREPALLGRLAQEALDLALERGGDQAVVKSPDHTWFYGGRAKSVGKRSQVQSRLTATELHRLFEMCNNVVIMGHKGIDFDVLGAAFALAEAARYYGRKVQVAVDHPGGTVERLLDVITRREPGLLAGGEVAGSVSSQTLLLVVDVHRPSLMPYPSLLSRAGYIGVIDHHRRSEEFLERANISYLVPSASSASELAVELIRYLPDQITISPLAATALLAGLIVDTKKFSVATSAGTFRNAAWLRDAGADPAVIRNLFTDSLEVMLYRARLLQNVEIVNGRFALAMNEQEFPDARTAASRAADTLLDVEGVEASFALYPTGEGAGISARSRGLVNAQRVMEQFGGGGHTTVAGARLTGADLQEVRRRLLDILAAEQEGET